MERLPGSYTHDGSVPFCCWEKSDALIDCAGLYFRKHGQPWELVGRHNLRVTVHPGYCIVNLTRSRVTGEERIAIGKMPSQTGLKDVFFTSG